MGETRRFIIVFLVSLAGVGIGLVGSAHAEELSVTQEIHVQATVPDRRHIILDPSGRIIRIISNTPNDVAPEAFVGDDTPDKQVPLTPELYRDFRKHVPVGTSKAGILYERATVLATMTVPMVGKGNSVPLEGTLAPASPLALQPSNSTQTILLANHALKGAVAAGL
jgi:hypothetical protein